MAIEAHVVPDPVTQRVRIWIVDSTPHARLLLLLLPGGRQEWVPLDDRDPAVDPTLILPELVAQALLAGLAGEVKRDEPASALDDARIVRDRLLALVEIVVKESTEFPVDRGGEDD
jgi:hypothetical protein